MSKLKEYSDSAKLNALVTEVIKHGKTYRDKLHIAAVYVLAHAADFGQCKPMDRLFASLVSNDKVAFRQYIRRAHILVAMMQDKENPKLVEEFALGKAKLDQEIIEGYAKRGQVFSYAKERWSVVSSKDNEYAKANRATFLSLAEKLFDAGEGYQPFYARNNFASVREIGDAEIFDMIKRVRDKLAKGSTDNEKLNVSDRVKKMVNTVADQMETFIEGFQDETPAKSSPPTKAKPEARPN